MKIGIFGGSFNPIHKAHIELVKKAHKEAKLDYVYVVPNNKSPDKKIEVEKISSKLKYKIVYEAIKAEKLSWLKVSDYEIKRKGISYTIDTIKYFKSKYPNDDLYLIVGEDQYASLENWKDIDQISKLVKFISLKRTNNKFVHTNKFDKNTIFIKDFFWPISSTELLTHSDWGKIPLAAKKVIAKNWLYLKTTTYLALYDKRYDHSVSVATHAKRLAKKHFINPKKAYLAGLVHDLFKYMPIDEQYQYVNLNSEYTNIPAKALHGYVCAIWLEKEYGLKDNKITEAIRKHTLASHKMSKMDKIIFVADKIANDRKGADAKRFRRMAYKNLDLTFANLLKYQINYLSKKGIEPHEETLAAYNKYALGKKENKKYYGYLKKIN